MGHNVPESPRSAFIAIRYASNLALVQIALDGDGQGIFRNGWQYQEMYLFTGFQPGGPLVPSKRGTCNVPKVQRRRSEVFLADFPLPALTILQMEKVVSACNVSNANVGNVA